MKNTNNIKQTDLPSTSIWRFGSELLECKYENMIRVCCAFSNSRTRTRTETEGERIIDTKQFILLLGCVTHNIKVFIMVSSTIMVV